MMTSRASDDAALLSHHALLVSEFARVTQSSAAPPPTALFAISQLNTQLKSSIIQIYHQQCLAHTHTDNDSDRGNDRSNGSGNDRGNDSDQVVIESYHQQLQQQTSQTLSSLLSQAKNDANIETKHYHFSAISPSTIIGECEWWTRSAAPLWDRIEQVAKSSQLSRSEQQSQRASSDERQSRVTSSSPPPPPPPPPSLAASQQQQPLRSGQSMTFATVAPPLQTVQSDSDSDIPASRPARTTPTSFERSTTNTHTDTDLSGGRGDGRWQRGTKQKQVRTDDFIDSRDRRHTQLPTKRSGFLSVDSDDERDQLQHRKPKRSNRAADDEEHNGGNRVSANPFMSGLDKLAIDDAKQGRQSSLASSTRASGLPNKTRRFIPPRPVHAESDGQPPSFVNRALSGPNTNSSTTTAYDGLGPVIAEKLKSFDPKLVEMIRRDEMESSKVTWSDIAGLDYAKKAVKEVVILPMIHPEWFTGIRTPPKGMLLFGPPGTGKTMIGQAMAREANAKFYSISASSLTSKWHGEGEKLVRTLFGIAALFPPAIIFIDEIDALLSSRTDNEFEASRRMKTELLIQMEGAASNSDDRILVLGATNRPQDLDEAAKRRLVKRLYIPLPNNHARIQLLKRVMGTVDNWVSDSEFAIIAQQTKGYSGADLKSLCREAAMEPLRTLLDKHHNSTTDADTDSSGEKPRPVTAADFEKALTAVKPSVALKDLKPLEEWDKLYGMQVDGRVDD